VRTAPKLDAFKPVIDAMLREDLTAPRKQRHTAKPIFSRLVDEHTGPTSGDFYMSTDSLRLVYPVLIPMVDWHGRPEKKNACLHFAAPAVCRGTRLLPLRACSSEKCDDAASAHSPTVHRRFALPLGTRSFEMLGTTVAEPLGLSTPAARASQP